MLLERRSTGKRTAVASGLLALGLVVLGWQLLLGAGPRGVTTPGGRERASAESRELHAEPRVGGAPAVLEGARPPDPPARVAAPNTATEQRAPPPVAPAPRKFVGAAAILRVVLRLPDEWRAQGGSVYALPAGQPGRRRNEDLPRVEIDAKTTEVMLPLPHGGPWDVGFVGQFGQALVPGVDPRTVADVVVDARNAAPIRFRPRGATSLAPGGRLVAETDRDVAFPGRGQSAGVSVGIEIGDGFDLRTPPLAVGTSYRLRVSWPPAVRAPGGAPGLELRPDRETARAGEEVDLVPVRLGLVRVTLQADTPLPEAWRKDWKSDIWVAAGAQGEAEPEPLHFASTWLQRDGTFKESMLLLPLVPGRYAFEMIPSGSVFHATRQAIAIGAGEVLDLRVRASPDPARSPFHPPPAGDGPGTQISLGITPPPAHRWYLAGEVREEGRLHWEEHGARSGEMEIYSERAILRALVVAPPDRASDTLSLPARGSYPVLLRPRGTWSWCPKRYPIPAWVRFACAVPTVCRWPDRTRRR
jgi:hypothetical protein